MLVILTGKSASGKDTLKNELVKKGMIPMLSVTTRPMRQGEQEGREYHFINNNEWKDNDYLESRLYTEIIDGKEYDYKYGTPKMNLDDNLYIAIKDKKGAVMLKDYYGEDNVFILYIDAPYRIRTARALDRAKQSPDFDEEKWEKEWDARREADEKHFEDIGYADLIYHNYPMIVGKNYLLEETFNQKVIDMPEEYQSAVKGLYDFIIQLAESKKEKKDYSIEK